uniref:Flagellar basal body-associated protein n=1 Tax=Siphoviridae sp. ct8aS59 TaxID=2825365 RepID=A0A8S5TST5_9CAUD|nr:MAG TPA: flagellar basal body-associated protein [Siphoviridae sp. ct8aS59]
MKIKFFLIALLSALVVSCSGQELNISVENNSKDYHAPQVFYWVNNNTGAEIKNLEWSLNGVYFYTADLPVDGDHLDLFDFAKKDGTRYDYYAIKPIELKANCKAGRYAIKFDDIPFDFGAVLPVVDEYKADAAVYSWTADFAAENKTADGAAFSLSVSFGYKTDDKATITEIMAQKDIITVYLRQFIAQKSAADLSPKKEDSLQTEIKNAVNDEILSSSRIRAVRFNSLKTE